MTDKHPPTTRRALAYMLTAAVVANTPHTAHAAAREPSSVESRAAEAIKAFAAGAEQEAKGDQRAAAHHYRDAAEASIAALDALDRSSGEHLSLAQTLAKRVIKAYSAGLLVVDDPAVRAAAWGWCTRMEATFKGTDAPGFAEIQEACAQWQPAQVAQVARPAIDDERPPSGSRTRPHTPEARHPNLRRLQIGLGISAAVTGLLLTTSLVALSRVDHSQRLGVGIPLGFLVAGGALSTSLHGVYLHRIKRMPDKVRLTASWQPGGFGLVAQGSF